MTTPGPLPDTLITPVVTELLECLCAQFAASTTGPVCRCCFEPGPVPPPMDSCGCECPVGSPPVTGHGQAWVRVASQTPTVFPSWPAKACRTTRAITVTLEIGVYRCARGVVRDGQPPSCADTSYDAQVVQADAAAIRRAIACCTGLPRRVQAQTWTPLGPMGGCVGSAWTLSVDLIQRGPVVPTP